MRRHRRGHRDGAQRHGDIGRGNRRDIGVDMAGIRGKIEIRLRRDIGGNIVRRHRRGHREGVQEGT